MSFDIVTPVSHARSRWFKPIACHEKQQRPADFGWPLLFVYSLSAGQGYPACIFSCSSWRVLHSIQSVVTGLASRRLVLICSPQDSHTP